MEDEWNSVPPGTKGTVTGKSSLFGDIQLLGCIVVLITEEREYHEYRVSKKTINTILEMDIKQHLTKLKK